MTTDYDIVELVEIEELPEQIDIPAKPGKFVEAVLEDKQGREMWVRTRLCYCEHDAITDCRFHPPTERGWDTCPNTEHAKKSKQKGRWLWAHNPNFGKPPEDSELTHVEVAL